MALRGPDGHRAWRRGPLALGHALMRVTEEDAFDAQPIIDPAKGLTLVADLRLDNREELACNLGIERDEFKKMPDSALLMQAYKKWGEDCAERLLGDFAFAVWDAHAQKLVLGRDHMGQRYVHYHHGPNFFVFATEKKGLWASADVPCRLDDLRLAELLTFDFSKIEGASLSQDIFGVLGGTTMTVSADGQIRNRRYWVPHADPVHVGRDEPYYIETYRRLLSEAVACRVRRSIRPVGLFMSGGFDSTAIAALAGPAMTVKKRRLIAVASVMPEDYRGPLRDVRKSVEFCRRDMPHLEIRYVTRDGFGLFEKLDETFLRTDLPSSPNRVANRALFTALLDRGVRVVMDGHGGDYTVNVTSNGWLADRLLHGYLRTFIAELRAYRRNRSLSYWKILKHEVLRPLLPRRVVRAWDRFRNGLPLSGASLPLNPTFLRSLRAKGANLRSGLPKTSRRDRWASLLAWHLSAQDSPHSPGHITAAAYGLEYAQPFHDKRLIEFALAVPPSLYVRNGRDRYLARQAFADLYPLEFGQCDKEYNDRTPDFITLVERERPQLLKEIDRMSKNSRLSRIFDFPRMRGMLTQPADGRSRVLRARQAILALMTARFVEWNERHNR